MRRSLLHVCAAVAAALFASVVCAQAQKPAAPAQPSKTKEPWEYLKEPAFKQAYLKVLGRKSQTAWLVRRDGPAPEDRFITIGGQRYVMNTFCANHACKDNSALPGPPWSSVVVTTL